MRVLLLISLLLFVACTAPKNSTGFQAAEPPPKLTVEEKVVAQTPVEEKVADTTPGKVDFSCKTASDCKIKDVGSCCGYRPACVNKDSETFPAQVKAECAKKDMMGICGFPAINSCTCTNNKCAGVADGAAEEALQ